MKKSLRNRPNVVQLPAHNKEATVSGKERIAVDLLLITVFCNNQYCNDSFDILQPYSISKPHMESTRAKFYLFISNLSVLLLQLNLTKLKLEYLKSALSAKKKDINSKQHRRKKFSHHSNSTFFEFSSSLLLEYGR